MVGENISLRTSSERATAYSQIMRSLDKYSSRQTKCILHSTSRRNNQVFKFSSTSVKSLKVSLLRMFHSENVQISHSIFMNAKVKSCLARDVLHMMDLQQTFAESRYHVTKILKTAIFVHVLKTGEFCFQLLHIDQTLCSTQWLHYSAKACL